MRAALALAGVLAVVVACSEPAREAVAPPPVERVVTLAPNLAELMFAIGAGEQVVGVSAWSDYPPEATALPQVGDAFAIDQEQLALLQPDLLLVWESGTPLHTVEELRQLGYRVEAIRTRGLADIATALRQLGALTGHGATAEAAAARFEEGLRELRAQFAHESPINVFYQVSARPLYTVNAAHYVSELIDLCGGRNVFADLSELAPTVSVEAVLARDPEVMLASTDAGDSAFEEWDRWPGMAAQRYGNQFLLPGDEIARATPRLLVAGNAMCLALRIARTNREAAAET